MVVNVVVLITCLISVQYMQDLTSSAGEDVVLAMNTFIKRLLAVSDPSQMKVLLYALLCGYEFIYASLSVVGFVQILEAILKMLMSLK